VISPIRLARSVGTLGAADDGVVDASSANAECEPEIAAADKKKRDFNTGRRGRLTAWTPVSLRESGCA
jgi:hypothetical protein